MQCSETIKQEHFNKWYELFKACNGRFICNPNNLFGNSVNVIYEFDDINDYKRFCEGWERLNMNIV